MSLRTLPRGRVLLMALLAAAGLMLLAGCVRAELDMTMHSADTVTGTVTVTLDRDALTSSGQDVDQLLDPTRWASGPHITAVAPYADARRVGRVYTFAGASAPAAAPVGPGSGLDIVHVGEDYRLTGTPTFAADPSPLVLADGSWQVAVTFPGRVLTSNGTVAGRTVTWSGPLSSTTRLAAVADDGLTREEMAVILFGGLALAAGTGAVLTHVVRSRRARRPAPCPSQDLGMPVSAGRATWTSDPGVGDCVGTCQPTSTGCARAAR